MPSQKKKCHELGKVGFFRLPSYPLGRKLKQLGWGARGLRAAFNYETVAFEMINRQTQLRRAFQPLWNQFNLVLRPYLAKGTVLAISGGPDSRALLEGVASWTEVRKNIVVASINHGQRVEAAQEIELCLKRAKRLGFDVYAENLYCPSLANEADLRERRYRALVYLCKEKGLASICTAHHQGDEAESFLMAALGLGGGSLGASMGEVTSFSGINIIRPFLSLKKEQLTLPLTLQSLDDFVLDALDEKRAGQRAVLRHELMPVLNSFQPNSQDRLAHFAKIQAQNAEALISAASKLLVINHDSISLKTSDLNPGLIRVALRLALNSLCPGKDFRQAGPTIEKIILNLQGVNFSESSKGLGLDHIGHELNVSKLAAKQYILPGAIISTNGSKIAIRRI